MNKEFEKRGKKWSCPILRHYNGICLQEPRETTEDVPGQPLSETLSRGRPNYEGVPATLTATVPKTTGETKSRHMRWAVHPVRM